MYHDHHAQQSEGEPSTTFPGLSSRVLLFKRLLLVYHMCSFWTSYHLYLKTIGENTQNTIENVEWYDLT